MRPEVVEELGKKIIFNVCSIGMSIEEVAATFDLVMESLEAVLIYEKIGDLLSGGVVGEAEEILKEAFDNVDKPSRD